MASNSRYVVSMGDVFPCGAYVVSEVEPVRDFERSTAERFVQQGDKHTGLPLWAVSVLDANPEVRNSDKTVVVKIMDTVRPVPPEATGGTPFRAVEFDGLTVTPYLDDKACSGPKGGERHRCRARMAYSLRATGMHAPSKGSKWSGANEGKAAA
jgi:hypothetical protein